MYARVRIALACFLFSLSVFPHAARACDSVPAWARSACGRLDQIWSQGGDDLYLTGYAWHNRGAYSADKIRSFREFAIGGGYGRSIYDEDGDWQGLYAMAFLDSHSKVEPIAGYGFLKIGQVSENFRLGAGYTVFLTARRDIMHYVPFPGVLPLVGAGYRNAMLYATYIPGGQGAGNVLFVFGRWAF
ncbi:lipid IV(A) palmitoyltransferase PagP [Achromobacter sp. Marseille-Q4962]|uniref:lipid IV(A) palmitoyltransferase PagP n=1 Tax=Achromobacter sp. Marseille-Q4962 TaxID=2942202 RepID=UPI002073D510|nr:lipid IV(A) palmitoyltransferase PagP [Achromobacter sp. Marseille-Q4962]